MKKIKKTILGLSPLMAVAPISMAASCFNSKDKDNWDTKITIVNNWINEGFEDTNLEKTFLDLLSKRFNDLKNNDPKLKDKPNVIFEIASKSEPSKIYQDLKSDKENVDLGLMNYSIFSEDFIDGNVNENNLKLHLVSQASTLKFKWQSLDSDFYENGLITDKLRVAAENNNKVWFNDTNKEYPNWTDAYDEIPYFDGSKYKFFYETNKLTYVYHGAIMISGTKAKRDEIIKDWEDKNFKKFVSHGIAFKNENSAGKYKYQVALMARHFNKTISEINDYFRKNSNQIIKGKSIGKTLGKAASGVVPHIGFADEGDLNWTPKAWGETLYKPDGFDSNKPVNDATNDVVRVLTLTNPAAYDVVFGRPSLPKEQVDLIKKALMSLTLEENTYGIYTGYNKFQDLTLDLFKKFIKLQIQAETTKSDLIKGSDIPIIKEN
ncbi:ABC transporter thiamine pyrophosphate-binding lipoprotein p37/Cypl [Mycoplasma sp. Mirounga ES2805-ORL]|uniref:ABC transporter thiamine pyrophosphate-binding lipoprotein p37/Cypl n=1 Tax=Mycoplasma sp. Mirounga ES2805-ORL TaxID=754514 RepID=UPI00197BCC31|nr:ABC transporter substrate-binding protein [Mycoplasma sp. Mirounga ES2805-ORL]QSF13637.1 ABC transporter substrate-binding protein [Mycoplasma sp. Mirounga ES2805-ORL]